jgi:hypothetical protein
VEHDLEHCLCVWAIALALDYLDHVLKSITTIPCVIHVINITKCVCHMEHTKLSLKQ